MSRVKGIIIFFLFGLSIVVSLTRFYRHPQVVYFDQQMTCKAPVCRWSYTKPAYVLPPNCNPPSTPKPALWSTHVSQLEILVTRCLQKAVQMAITIPYKLDGKFLL